SVRISNELGAGHPKSAAFCVGVVSITSLIIAFMFGAVSLVFRHQLSYVFTSGQVVSDAVADLAPYLAGAILLNGVQPVLSGTHRHTNYTHACMHGRRDTRTHLYSMIYICSLSLYLSIYICILVCACNNLW
ncbi:protein TRANSPARENT TESTA 12-like, partial [Dorcoceras hygrometricum]